MEWIESYVDASTQKFDFSFEEEDSIEGMKKLIVDEVNQFRAEVRAKARASGQIRRQDKYDSVYQFEHQLNMSFFSLPIPSREDLINSPMQDQEGTTSNYTARPQSYNRPPSPVMDDPSESLERELAGTHLGARR